MIVAVAATGMSASKKQSQAGKQDLVFASEPSVSGLSVRSTLRERLLLLGSFHKCPHRLIAVVSLSWSQVSSSTGKDMSSNTGVGRRCCQRIVEGYLMCAGAPYGKAASLAARRWVEYYSRGASCVCGHWQGSVVMCLYSSPSMEIVVFVVITNLLLSKAK